MKECLEEKLLENTYRAEEVIKYINYGLEEIEGNEAFTEVIEQLEDLLETIKEYKTQWDLDLADIANKNINELNGMYNNSVI